MYKNIYTNIKDSTVLFGNTFGGIVMKKKLLIIGMFFICSLVFYSTADANTNANDEKEDFSTILKANNITLIGSMSKLTEFQIDGLLMDIDSKYMEIYEKYENYIFAEGTKIELSPEEILELQYYTLSEIEQEDFLNETRNQIITIFVDEHGTILISYNPNF